ncbi:hypothetical protein PpBr36_02651 [Pyricularia pennisetigena]|uniref:hypothetical protein n=1 Tax=Pyricularia pennisetigena TaxID=1578925 RepID=UPI00114FC7A7|nr:hypothetical protein PpBr36_02651 [Pyricularia pennisetigena]TLS30086.1 hypothetical protein PpBr36_02651 [Pyricularia pennisetigena]
MARAICDLDAVSRWAVTGTPVQNRLGDLATLLRFARAYPYTDPKQFETDVSQLWKEARSEEAVRRLTLLSSTLLLRRPQSTINLPRRQDWSSAVEFSSIERKIYGEAKERVILKIDEALNNGSETSRSYTYANVLQQIESLRLICDLGKYFHCRHKQQENQLDAADFSNAWQNIAQATFNSEREMGALICHQCQEKVDMTQTALEYFSASTKAMFFACLTYLCPECTLKVGPKSRMPTCGHAPSCDVTHVSTAAESLEEVHDTAATWSSPPLTTQFEAPSKVQALVADICRQPPGTKSVVFSTWRMTLDLVEKALTQASIPNVRFDGNVKQKDRRSVMDKFKSDPNVRVMLLTLSCGAVGLTLTVASRAYLMEPHWNPTLEDQALARIHRIGQTREVTTIRFFIRDSFEEEVIKLQAKKRQLAAVLLGPHDGSLDIGNKCWDRLHELRQLL